MDGREGRMKFGKMDTNYASKEEGRKKGGTNKVNQKKSTPTVIQRNLTVKLVW